MILSDVVELGDTDTLTAFVPGVTAVKKLLFPDPQTYVRFTIPEDVMPVMGMLSVAVPVHTKIPEAKTGEGTVVVIVISWPLAEMVVFVPLTKLTVPVVELAPFTVIAVTVVPSNAPQLMTRFCAVPPFVHPVPASTLSTPAFEIMGSCADPDKVIPVPSATDKTPVFEMVGYFPPVDDKPDRTDMRFMLTQLAINT